MTNNDRTFEVIEGGEPSSVEKTIPDRPTIDMHALESAVNAATTALMNAHAPHLPPLHWYYDIDRQALRPMLSAVVGMEHGRSSGLIGQQWASHFELTEDEPSEPSCRGWSGSVVDRSGRAHGVRVWCVTDRDAWEADMDRRYGPVSGPEAS
ncbi:hypothetical protein NONO_c73740 [Nocardia nova SH22a]|uniref:Uncharacterized protein n=1 Tax=Nocardia nova SH22a TaxID=1415166 RepID=W5TRW6_9NOCA|nr:hypothetical protein [Nocardia nova]AHH22130.1 hypothetical protein NONO_c73740 [Nocardia nova SH22a]